MEGTTLRNSPPVDRKQENDRWIRIPYRWTTFHSQVVHLSSSSTLQISVFIEVWWNEEEEEEVEEVGKRHALYLAERKELLLHTGWFLLLVSFSLKKCC